MVAQSRQYVSNCNKVAFQLSMHQTKEWVTSGAHVGVAYTRRLVDSLTWISMVTAIQRRYVGNGRSRTTLRPNLITTIYSHREKLKTSLRVN